MNKVSSIIYLSYSNCNYLAEVRRADYLIILDLLLSFISEILLKNF